VDIVENIIQSACHSGLRDTYHLVKKHIHELSDAEVIKILSIHSTEVDQAVLYNTDYIPSKTVRKSVLEGNYHPQKYFLISHPHIVWGSDEIEIISNLEVPHILQFLQTTRVEMSDQDAHRFIRHKQPMVRMEAIYNPSITKHIREEEYRDIIESDPSAEVRGRYISVPLYPIDTDLSNRVFNKGTGLEVFELMSREGAPIPNDMVEKIVKTGDQDTIYSLVRRSDIPWHPSMERLLKEHNLHILDAVISKDGYIPDQDTMNKGLQSQVAPIRAIWERKKSRMQELEESMSPQAPM